MSDKGLISAFIILNLATVGYVNRPAWLSEAWDNTVNALPAPIPWLKKKGELIPRMYGHVTGLDRYWDMFSNLPRFNWWYVIKAEYADGTTVLLPLPRQSERTFLQRHFFDFKEAKFELNIYPRAGPPQSEEVLRYRKAYAYYLARQYPTHNGAPIRAILWEVRTQRLLPAIQAELAGTHLDPEVALLVLDDFRIAADSTPAK